MRASESHACSAVPRRWSKGRLPGIPVDLRRQPFDAPGAAEVARVLDHIDGDDLLLFATDFPHCPFEAREALPPGLPVDLIRRMTSDNPLATYPRLRETLAQVTLA